LEVLEKVGGEGKGEWRVDGFEILKEVYPGDESINYNDSDEHFPKAIRLLDIPRYRSKVLMGIILSVGSKNDSTQRPAATSLVDYATVLPLTVPDPHSTTTPNTIPLTIIALISEIIDVAKKQPLANQVIIPTLQTLDVLLEADALGKLEGSEEGITVLHEILTFVTKNADKLKNVQRIQVSMKICIGFVAIPKISTSAIQKILPFLCHQFPKIRSACAEALYTVLQTHDIIPSENEEEVDSLLLETSWISATPDESRKAGTQVVDILSQAKSSS
jgi:hypothetical protein